MAAANEVLAVTPDRDELDETAQAFVAVYGETQVANHWHMIIHVLSSFIVLGLIWLAWEGWTRPERIIYVKVEPNGRASVVPGETFSNQPDEIMLRHFLTQFTYMHFSRRRATITTDLSGSSYFLADSLAQKYRDTWAQTDVIRKVLADPYDLEVRVTNVILQHSGNPSVALVDFTEEKTEPASRAVLEKRYYTATIEYTISNNIPNETIPKNPIGLNITSLRRDQSFRAEQ